MIQLLIAATIAFAQLPSYDAGRLGLGTAFIAKEMCSCIFVSGQSEEYCRAYTETSPKLVFSASVDQEEKSVTARGAFFLKRKAVWRGKREGCGLL